jgi:hypothetical protein
MSTHPIKPSVVLLALSALLAAGCSQSAPTSAPIKGVSKLAGDAPSTGGGSSPLSGDANQAQQQTSDANPNATIASAQAIDEAKAFCQAAGVTTSGAESAVFTGLHAPGDTSYKYWKPVWDVTLGTVTVELCDTDGVITGFDAGPPAKAKSGSVISRDAALARGAQVIKAAHITESLGDASAAIDTKLSGSVWAIDWPRLAQGHPFADQQVSVTLDQNTGALRSLAVAFDTPVPEPARAVLTEDEAVEKATTFLESKNQHPSDLWTKKKAALTWVTPKTFGTIAKVRPPVLTWRCSFTNATQDYADIPVDAVTAEIVTSALNYNAN